jgi:hypothetical protein
LVDQTPDQAFAAITNTRDWWTGEFAGTTGELDGEFTYRYKDMHYSKQKVTEAVPGKRLVWLVTDSRLEFVKDKHEWNGTTITFDIARKGDKTEVRFTHAGLDPSHECFADCSNAWSSLIGNKLRALIAKG